MNYQKVYMNQIYSSNMMGYLSQMWRNQLLCDAVIKTGNIITKAHRIVLIAACPMLQNMENASLGSHLEVRMAADIKQDSVNAFLQYIYEGYMMLTEENCKDIEKMAKLLQVESGRITEEMTGSSMSSSYKPGGQDPFERVPRIGSGIQHSDSGVKEDTLEVVHKEPPERDADGWPKESRLPPVHRTQSISVSSQLSKETNVQIVNVPNESDRFRVQQTPQSVQMSQARPTPPRTSTAPEPAQQSFSQIQSTAQKLEAQRIAADVMASLPSIHMQASSSVSQQQSMNAPAQKINIDPLPPPLHGPSTSTMRTSTISQPPTHPTQQTPPRLASKPFAAGSAMQATESHSPLSDKREKESNVAQGTSQVIPISAPQESRIPSQNISLQPATTEQIQNVEKLLAGDDVGMQDRKSEPSTSEASPDLSIIKIEEADTGGLDMYVDLPDDTKAMMQAHEGGTCESEDEGDFGQGEASNEGSNFSGEQMGAWQGQDVSFQGQDASFSGDGSFQGQEGSYQGFKVVLARKPGRKSRKIGSDRKATSQSAKMAQKRRRMSNAEKQKLYRLRRDQDPVKRQEYLEKCRRRYHEQKGKLSEPNEPLDRKPPKV
ncbi:hypothetical protein FSP39_019806 [Pinctada imbricata]|uniref:BTB domain-containing protein n=1 Tax=Pinctada imbricata TaxID=66713 RepID=A0AA89C739_PINIB|nr:hypothetical protein FSP39_019806 [Pinctada imbricata]